MMTYRVGAAASPAAGQAMAEYYLAGTLKPEPASAALYYTGAAARDERAASFWRDAVVEGHLAAGGTVAELRPDLSAAFAARLGIADPSRPLTASAIANLLNATRLDGGAIAGRKKHSATRSVAEIFGLDPKEPPPAEAIRNVLAGRRADGAMPQTPAGKPLPAAVVAGARKRFKAALGVPAHREPNGEEMAHLEEGRLANSRLIDAAGYRRRIHATRPPVGFVDLTFSADKSLSVAWALAPTAAERAALLDIHRQAVAATMAYAETQLGFASNRAAGLYAVEPGALAWIGFQHYTARPAVDIERHDREGRAYTDIREVPLKTADPQLHTHVTVLNSVLTESGRIGALDLDRLAGRVKELGAVYHAHVAAAARRLGIAIALDQRTGAARLSDIPSAVRHLFSKRTVEAQAAARDFARRNGIDWDAVSSDQKVALLKAGAAETRQAKEDANNDFAVWREQAAAASYRPRSVLRPDQIAPEPAAAERHAAAYRAALPLLAGELERRAVLDGQELREAAARALIVAGIGDKPGDDIDAVLQAFREKG